ncbi:cytochrome c oxidase assembly protein [Specibacter sp. NPDC078692]|uniref:cytochrome c oxidase assembly protein n=1 Tax=Specibacter sp. NPDC078692 TaxID=3155818 RepID=UPI00342E4D62
MAALAVLIFSFADIAGIPISGSSDFAAKLASYVTEIPTGTAWLVVVTIAALVATMTYGARSATALAVTAGLALAGLLPVVLIGHAAGGSDHEQAVNSLGLHLVGVCLWFGGLIALCVAGPALGNEKPWVVKRYSNMAGFAFVLVVASGIINALIRIDVPAGMASAYGYILLLKTAATIFLGVVGLMHRKWIIPALTTTKHPGKAQRLFWRLVVVELLIMGAVSGLAAGLSRTPTGTEAIGPSLSPAEVLTGYRLPPELTIETWFSVWRPDWLWIALAIVSAYLYLRAIRHLQLRGDSWPAARSVSWLIGLGLLVFFTSGGPAVYGRVLFSAHVFDHLALTMIVPVLLALSSPLVLALRVFEPRTDGSMGPREWVAAATKSRLWTVATHPGLTSATLIGSMALFYYSDAFGFALRQHAGHELMNVYFVVIGCLFAQSMIGKRASTQSMTSYRARIVLLLVVTVAQVAMGTALRFSTTVIEPEWFLGMGREWGLAPLADQRSAGAIQGVVGLAMGLMIILVMSIQRRISGLGVVRSRITYGELGRKNAECMHMGKPHVPCERVEKHQ